MSDWIIKVENIGKRYRVRHQQERQRYVALSDVIADRFKRLFLSRSAVLPAPKDFCALKISILKSRRARWWGSLAGTAQQAAAQIGGQAMASIDTH